LEPLVSVICITRNHERFCIESLDSVLNQTYKNIEWIILDAASTDKTVELIDNWLVENNVQSVFLKEKELKPVTINLNKALTFAQGEYVQFLSLDDALLANKISDQINLMQKNNFVGLVFSDSVVVDENSKVICDAYCGLDNAKFEEFRNIEFYRLWQDSARIQAPTTLYRKQVFYDLGGFDEEITIEDWDFYLRIAKSKWEIRYQQQKLAVYRVVNDSLSRSTNIEFQINILKTYFKHKINKKKLTISFFEKNRARCFNERLLLFKYALKSDNRAWKIYGLLYMLGFKIRGIAE
jgi:glycosyltransferase involved in cell wall biosynthesis